MPSPLEWNGRRQWDYNISLRKPVMYLIREHINMFTDLGKDWSAGPPSDYHRFTPMVYTVDLELRMFQLNAYVNDHNIIDKPSIREENGEYWCHALWGYVLTHCVQRAAHNTRDQSQNKRGDRLDHFSPCLKCRSVLDYSS